MKSPSVALVFLLASSANAFTVNRPAAAASIRTTTALNLELPRLDLPDAVTTKLEENDLKNPNTMTEDEYRAYSGAAILGTLLFLIPGAFVTGLGDALGEAAGSALFDFAISAIVGGGAAIYISLKDDELGEKARGYGAQLLDTVGLPTLRYDLPEAATDKMGEIGLMNPNTMSEADYNGYSGAAVAGTLAFFLLPGALLTGEFNLLLSAGGSFVTDFLLSAIVGGGAAIYLSLRDDEIADTVNGAGIKLLDAVDGVVDKISGSLNGDE